jgi:peptide/nickel transport system substrate-binding protein
MAEGRDDGSGNPLTRRSLLVRGAGAAGALSTTGLVLAACGNSGKADSASEPADDPTTPSGPAKRGGTIKVGIGDYFSKDGLDPVIQGTTFGLMSAGMLHDTLVHIDDEWTVKPMLAEEWTADPKGRHFTYKLRQGVVFPTSGKTLDADDVAWSIKHVLDPKTGSSGLGLFEQVLAPSGIKVVDKQTIRFDLKQANVFFPILLGFWYGRISEANWDFTKGSGGTGPFKSVSFKGGQGFEFVRNENYWQDGLPYLDGINGVVISEPATKAQAVLSGDVHIIDEPEFSTVPLFEKSDAVEMITGPFGSAQDFGIDGTRKPYNDPNVRKAMKMLLDREKFVQVVCHGQATAKADVMTNTKDPFYPSDLKPVAFDPEQAKALLKKSAYPDGFKDKIYTSPTFRGLNDASALLKQSMAAAGIDLSIVSQNSDAWGTHYLKSGVFANYWGRQHVSTMIPQMVGTDGPRNESHYSDQKVDKWIAEARSTDDAERQKQIYGEILHTYNDEASSLWPMDYGRYFPHKKALTGVIAAPTDMLDFRRASLAS